VQFFIIRLTKMFDFYSCQNSKKKTLQRVFQTCRAMPNRFMLSTSILVPHLASSRTPAVLPQEFTQLEKKTLFATTHTKTKKIRYLALMAAAFSRSLSLGALTVVVALFMAALSAPVVRSDIQQPMMPVNVTSTSGNNTTASDGAHNTTSTIAANGTNITAAPATVTLPYRVVSTLWHRCISAGTPSVPTDPATECAVLTFPCDDAERATRATRGLYIAGATLAFMALCVAHLFTAVARAAAGSPPPRGRSIVESGSGKADSGNDEGCGESGGTLAGRGVVALAFLSGACGLAGWAVSISQYTLAQCGAADSLQSADGAALGASIPLAVAATCVAWLVVVPSALFAL
jgi:hypothetical protein